MLNPVNNYLNKNLKIDKDGIEPCFIIGIFFH